MTDSGPEAALTEWAAWHDRLTKERDPRVLAAYTAGLSINRITVLSGIQHATVRRIIRGNLYRVTIIHDTNDEWFVTINDDQIPATDARDARELIRTRIGLVPRWRAVTPHDGEKGRWTVEFGHGQ